MNRPILACLALLLLTPLAAAHRGSFDVDVSLQVDDGLSVHARATPRAHAHLDFEWDWGDGTRSAGASARHVFAHPGHYEVTLTVTDERTGECRTERRSLVVEAEAEPEAEAEAETDADAEADAEAKKGARRGGASASVSAGARLEAEARVGFGRSPSPSAAEENDAPSSRGGHARLSSQSHHETPGAGLALGLPALAGLALALRRP